MERVKAWTTYSDEQLQQLEAFSNDYMAFLNAAKIERECVTEGVRIAEEAGFKRLKGLIDSNTELKAGDRVYSTWMGKSFLMFILGKKPMQEGMNILGAHIDSPRIDVKQNPLYEEGDFTYLDTHYYGYIKKYQWVARALALHGVVSLKNGTKITLAIGEKKDDPVFYITDLLPHIADDQMKKTASHVVEGEALDIIVGNKPLQGEEKEPVRAGVLKILREQYGIEEDDFLSAELEAVPAGESREVGFDRSLIAAYGHDDRVCAYPSVRALTDFEGVPEYTLCCILTDKEENGSYGASGMRSKYFENTVAELMQLKGEFTEIALRRALANSRMLSSDVSSGFDPLYASAYETKNAAFLGRGACFSKYTGSGGKGGSSDANAEFLGEIRRIMDDADVHYQTCEIGRVDVGGGGTIAHLCAAYGMNVIDAGVPVLSMHSPTEVVSKADVYEAYRAYCAFLRDARAMDME